MEFSSKSDVRKWAKKTRRNCSRDDESDKRIAEHLKQLAGDRSIALFVSHDGEPDILAHFSTADRDLYLPRVVSDSEIEFAMYHPDERLVPNRFGIPEPMTPAVDPREITVVAVPGLAFDRTGARIGFGAGFYDRWLKIRRGLGQIAAYGVAFDWQVVSTVFPEKHDQPVDAIVTELGVVEVAK